MAGLEVTDEDDGLNSPDEEQDEEQEATEEEAEEQEEEAEEQEEQADILNKSAQCERDALRACSGELATRR